MIVGAGPAGLTAALELLRRTDIVPIVLEQSDDVGGLARTTVYRGNRIDIGGHRFFTKSDRVMQWWLDLMPLDPAAEAGAFTITYQGRRREVAAAAFAQAGSAAAMGSDAGSGTAVADAAGPALDRVMLVRQRKSRIYFRRKLFDYPLRVNLETLRKLGLVTTLRIVATYLWSAAFPIRNPKNLEEFFVNRFGRELYATFFKAYTEKVWGVPCAEISAEWGEQRVKGLSIGRVLSQWLRKRLRPSRSIAQRDVETSLIERFLYPRLGPGQMWEIATEEIRARGGQVLLGLSVDRIVLRDGRVVAVEAVDARSGERSSFACDLAFSTMPVPELVRAIGPSVPADARVVAEGLQFRDFLTVGLLVRDLELRDPGGRAIEDTWIYIQEPEVLAGRLQFFNRWSPDLVRDPATTWIGVEYFCSEHDALWSRPDAELVRFAAEEMERIGILSRDDLLDGTVLRAPKAYPAYFGAYERFDQVRAWLDGIDNLFAIGRNGMHKYNNQDHSMLCAMTAVDNLIEGRRDKSNLWAVNTEMEYHESRAE